MKQKIAFFRFEASPSIGAGHAIRSCVVADALVEKGWECIAVTSSLSYDFIKSLKRFKRIEPDQFHSKPVNCDLFVIDHYGLDENYEKKFRLYCHKIVVIDDLANRKHDCDILLDQTYGREPSDYKPLVPEQCKILTGSDYVLLRNEFIELRPRALGKRRRTTEIKRILISMGGSDQHNHTLKALEMVKSTTFDGKIDVVLGFDAPHYTEIKNFLNNLKNQSEIYVNADMPSMIYEADLCIGAVGTSLWERYCLGVLTVPIVIADNQGSNYSALKRLGQVDSLSTILARKDAYAFYKCISIDGFGKNRLLKELEAYSSNTKLSLRKVTESDKEKIFCWQNIKEVRQYFNNPNPPSLIEHQVWFLERMRQDENPYWIICYEGEDCGVMSLVYNDCKNYYDLSWFIISKYRGRGLGTEAVKLAMNIVRPFKIHAFVKNENAASHNVFKKLGFEKIDDSNYISESC